MIEAPEWVSIAHRDARILVGGRIEKEGYARAPVLSPCDGRLLGTTPQLSAAAFQRAVDEASRAWNRGRGEWPIARVERRLQALEDFAADLSALKDQLARFLVWEIAKSWKDAQTEVERTLTYIADTLEAMRELERNSNRIQVASQVMGQIRRAPLGVALCMGPFNYPLNETFTTLIPALLLGNVVVLKIPRFGQLLWDLLLESLATHFPPGVINVVNGSGSEMIPPAVASGKIDVLAFIGSSRVATLIKQAHPHPHRFRTILGLDAKNPAIILPDADLELTVRECLKGALSYNGQRCTALKVLFVHRRQVDAFSEQFTQALSELKVGMPWENNVAITPLADPERPPALLRWIEQATQAGGRLLSPGIPLPLRGSLLPPAVILNPPLDTRIVQEEQFGPIVPIVTFEEYCDLEEYLLSSPFGMQASLFGRNPADLGYFIDILAHQVCRINLNSQCQRGPDVFPFTGRKSSAEGTLSVTDALRSFSIRTMVSTPVNALGRQVFRDILDGNHSGFFNHKMLV